MLRVPGSEMRGGSPAMTGNDLLKYEGYAIAEVSGSDKAEAVRKAAEFMDRFSFNRRKSAVQRYDFYRVRKLGKLSNGKFWYAVYYRHRRGAR